MMFEGYDDVYNASARLAILRELAEQADYRLTEGMLDSLLLAKHAISRGRSYVRIQIAWLEKQAGAVATRTEGDTNYVMLTQIGFDHVLRRHVIPGIKRAEPGGS